jgi:PPP family 3-phenylpropionic acid transporter
MVPANDAAAVVATAARGAGGVVARALSSFYFLLFAYIGVLLPWFPPLLEQRGFSASLIGLALLTIQVPRALLPPLWGLAADRLGRPRRILALSSITAGVAFAAIGVGSGVPVVLALLLAHGFFVVPVFPLAETLTFAQLGGRGGSYGRVRLWGSIGFIVASLAMGRFVGAAGLEIVPWVTGGLLAAAGLIALTLRPGPELAKPAPARAGGARAAASFPWRRFLPLLICATLGQASHGPYYTFFTIQLERAGVAALVIGALWAWAVIAEVGLMSGSAPVLSRLGLAGALRWSLGLAALRWALTALGPSVPLLFVVQTLHAGSFALLHIATVQLADHLSPDGRKAFGQSLVSAFAYGIGIGGGNFLAGLLAPSLGFQGLYVAATAVGLAGLLVGVGVSARRPVAG